MASRVSGRDVSLYCRTSIMKDHNLWAEIDLTAIASNIRQLRKTVHPDVAILASVKANGYGHGAVPVAKTALKNGVDMLGVARYGEAILLRQKGIDAPILILGHTSPDLTENLLQNNLIPTVFSLAVAEKYSAAALKKKEKLKVHLKVDTGMGRNGVLPDELAGVEEEGRDIAEVEHICKLEGLDVAGVYTHFACSDEKDKSSAKNQLTRFFRLLDRLSQRGIRFSLRHAANSAAVIDLPETHLDMVRPGIAVYGLYPSSEVDKKKLLLKPAMSIKARICQLKHVSAGFSVSYGSTFTTEKPTTIATVPIGYADGYDRSNSSCGYMLVGGQRAPVVGRVCMDFTMLDVGHIENVRIGDEVVILGSQGSDHISAEEIAARSGTINYEVVCTLMDRVPRIFIEQ